MKTTCIKCGKAIEGTAATGRPLTYCSVGCRRAAEHEVRRLNSRLEKLEGDLSNTRLGYGWEPMGTAKKLEAEIALQEARLRTLLAGGADAEV
mgnify:CR=1 FL=1